MRALTPAEISYVVDSVLGILVAGGLAAGDQLLASGTVDYHALLIAFVGGALAFGRAWIHKNYGDLAPTVPLAPVVAATPTDVPK